MRVKPWVGDASLYFCCVCFPPISSDDYYRLCYELFEGNFLINNEQMFVIGDFNLFSVSAKLHALSMNSLWKTI